ncbi:hypothetical protein F2Q69_00005028 [Brassica cretica]|uniref:Uncharacterized protein n=1 Tax=Brassica cretica TaxID=69181 RepID=A0A8S9P199_BRACR|nr:hypothetical protein F2Q69_00005028 [Brassica cretica]
MERLRQGEEPQGERCDDSLYTCDVPTLEGQSKSFLMIDVYYSSGHDEEVNETVHYSSEGGVKTENFCNSKLEEEPL